MSEGGTLYVVATPIGNLEDAPPRALRILREVDLIAAEDTRVTRKLLAHFDIHTPLTAFHAHSGERKTAAVLERLAGGSAVALVSDAGTPGISDPGGSLVRAAIEAGADIIPVPGPSAVAVALSASGLDPSRFVFEGFLPRGAGDRRKALARLAPLPHTLVFYESPARLAPTLAALRESLGDREAVVARELTKKFEQFVRGKLSEVEAAFRATAARGECVILVAGAAAEMKAAVPPDLEQQLIAKLREGLTVRDAARSLADATGLPRKDLYRLALDVRGKAL